METVKNVCKPVWELYHKMEDWYRRLMEQYAGTACPQAPENGFCLTHSCGNVMIAATKNKVRQADA